MSQTTAPIAKLDAAIFKLLGAITLGTIAVQLDSTMVNLAFNALLKEFHDPLTTVQWVATGYLLAMTTMIPLTGWAVERFGAKRLWMVSLGFLVGSVLCGLAWSMGSLIGFRVLQGLGGGMLIPLAQIVLAQAAGPDRFGRVGQRWASRCCSGRSSGRFSAASSSTIWAGAGSSWSTCRSAWPRWCPRRPASAPAARSRGRPPRPPRARPALPGLAFIVYGLSAAGTHGSFAAPGAVTGLAVGVALLLASPCTHCARGASR